MALIFALIVLAQLIATTAAGTSGKELRAATSRLLTSDTPVVFANFTRSSSNKKPRSDPSLFQRAMNLKSGQPFNFRVDKWQKLLRSRLFRGLTAHITKDSKGCATIQISGEELPSITFRCHH
jgi:hypothetical protein